MSARSGPPDWRLPTGVTRGLWQYVHDADVARSYDDRLAGSGISVADLSFVERHSPQLGRLLDLGCGTGRLLAAYAERGGYGIGVDLSENMLAIARSKTAGQRVDLLRANISQLDMLADECFDHVACLFGTLGMVTGAEARRLVVAHAARLLRPGGVFCLHVHNYWFSAWDPAGRRWLASDLLTSILRAAKSGDRVLPAHGGIAGLVMHLFTRREICRLLERAGLRVVEVQPVGLAADGALRWPWWLPDWRAYGFLIAARKDT